MNYVLLMLIGWALSTTEKRIKPIILSLCVGTLLGVVSPLRDWQRLIGTLPESLIVAPSDGHPPPELSKKTQFYANKYRIDPALFQALVKQESNWQFDAVSNKGALGLAQIMPHNAAFCHTTTDQLTDPDVNLDCGAKILADELGYWQKQFPDDNKQAIQHALASYNAGRPAVINRNALTEFPETREYVRRIWEGVQHG